MFLSDFEAYLSEYEPGAKKISLHTFRPKIAKDTLHLTIEASPRYFDLFFSSAGVLLYSIHYERTCKSKVIYGYNSRKQLVTAVKLHFQSNLILESSSYLYDRKGRIKKATSKEYSSGQAKVLISKQVHTYSGNSEFIHFYSNFEEDEIEIMFTYEAGKVLEEKAIRNNKDLIDWTRSYYDAEGKLVREESLDEHGSPDGVYHYFESSLNKSAGYLYTDGTSSYTKTEFMLYNAKGHYIHKSLLTDNEPTLIYERSIEYY